MNVIIKGLSGRLFKGPSGLKKGLMRRYKGSIAVI